MDEENATFNNSFPATVPSYSPPHVAGTRALPRGEFAGQDKLAIVLPALREGRNLPLVLENVRLVLRSAEIDWEVIVVDDDSGDGTEAIVQALSQEDARIRPLIRRGERGLSGAILHGWRHTDATILGAMDADGQHPADVLPRLIACVRQGNDVAIASRYVEGSVRTGSLMRRLASRVAILLARPLDAFDPPVQDPLSGFFLVRRHCVQNVLFQPAGFKLLLEILVRGRVATLHEIPFSFGHRHAGRSKANARAVWDYLALLRKLVAEKYAAVLRREPLKD
jgi:dolichol-phosphate mannosyltransferase